jgi:type VI protein secretion system component Hcp
VIEPLGTAFIWMRGKHMKTLAGLLCVAFAGSVAGLSQTTSSPAQTVSVTMTGPSSSWNCTFDAASFHFDLHPNDFVPSFSGVTITPQNDTNVTVEKVLDTCSPVLSKAVILAEKYPTVKVQVSLQTKPPTPLRVFVLSNVVWTSISSNFPTSYLHSVYAPRETLELAYEQIIIVEPQAQTYYGWSRLSATGAEILPAACAIAKPPCN